jgi:hypothetical protein
MLFFAFDQASLMPEAQGVVHEAAAADRTALAREFRRLGVRHLRLSTDGPWLPALAQGFTRTPDRTGHVA